jgi:Fe-S-cluster-containing hydrogenase component 2
LEVKILKTTKIVSIRREKCTGCHLCQLICSYTKTGEFNIEKSRIAIVERDKEGFAQMICRNCDEAPCMEACPAGAIVKRKEDGYVLLKEEKCVGCNMCVMVCPFNAIRGGNHVNYKCDTCDGQERCAAICAHGAIEFLDLNEISKRRRKKYVDRIKTEE